MKQEELNKLIKYTIHEHSNGMGTIGNCIKILNHKIKMGRSFDTTEMEMFIKWLEGGKKRSNDSLDYLYTRLKESKSI